MIEPYLDAVSNFSEQHGHEGGVLKIGVRSV